MIQVRPSEERGHGSHGWLDTHHTFSFAGYLNPHHMGFRQLRVINEDRVQPGRGFDTHEHWDMEILTIVLEGVLEHRDSLGNGSVIRPGELQRMTAGSGIRHSEFNPSSTEIVRFLQIWIVPERKALEPGYEQRAFPDEERRGALRLVASRDGRDDSLTIHQDVAVYASLLEVGQETTHPVPDGRHAWLQMTEGTITLNGTRLAPGDGASVSQETSLQMVGVEPARLVLFDLA